MNCSLFSSSLQIMPQAAVTLFEHVQSHTMALTHAKRVSGCSGWTGEMQAADVPVLRSWVLPNLPFPAAQGSLMWEHCRWAEPQKAAEHFPKFFLQSLSF